MFPKSSALRYAGNELTLNGLLINSPKILLFLYEGGHITMENQVITLPSCVLLAIFWGEFQQV